jgi:hypothetical protein
MSDRTYEFLGGPMDAMHIVGNMHAHILLFEMHHWLDEDAKPHVNGWPIQHMQPKYSGQLTGPPQGKNWYMVGMKAAYHAQIKDNVWMLSEWHKQWDAAHPLVVYHYTYNAVEMSYKYVGQHPKVTK